MLIFNEGQRPLLEFLRNLTPQVLLATTALLLWANLDFSRFDFSNWLPTLAFFLCAGLFCLAFLANTNQFLDAILENLGLYARFARRQRAGGMSPRRATFAAFGVMFRHRPTLLLDFIGTVVIVNMGLVAIAFAAFNAARSAWR
ncbi:hypothetical protein [Acidovorax sp. 62]|uniref:hypothetical protein n=1 Tax=Acidovorax sp. 62 TaxID=2035203 RepID=UPI000C19F28F|nr:hypothetical protein [Acidovorax sp. 62]